MSINVELRVTGIYFGSPLAVKNLQTITVTVPYNPTVKDVMDAAVAMFPTSAIPEVKLFSYSFTPSFANNKLESVNRITIYYNKPPLDPSKIQGGFFPPEAGLYVLDDELGTPYDKSLQYYHYRKTTVDKKDALIQLNIKSHFKAFNTPPDQPIEDGDLIVWRLVVIENSPLRSLRPIGTAMRSGGQADGKGAVPMGGALIAP